MLCTQAELTASASRLKGAYVAAQQFLLLKLAEAQLGHGAWPDSEEYDMVARLGRLASAEQLLLLKSVKDFRACRIERIQRLSGGERRWQPSPERWLRLQDQVSAARVEPPVASNVLDSDRGIGRLAGQQLLAPGASTSHTLYSLPEKPPDML